MQDLRHVVASSSVLNKYLTPRAFPPAVLFSEGFKFLHTLLELVLTTLLMGLTFVDLFFAGRTGDAGTLFASNCFASKQRLQNERRAFCTIEPVLDRNTHLKLSGFDQGSQSSTKEMLKFRDVHFQLAALRLEVCSVAQCVCNQPVYAFRTVCMFAFIFIALGA